jgi:hypothetical protein
VSGIYSESLRIGGHLGPEPLRFDDCASGGAAEQQGRRNGTADDSAAADVTVGATGIAGDSRLSKAGLSSMLEAAGSGYSGNRTGHFI